MSLIQPHPAGPLDIVGDIHGEYDALCSLMGHLGYDQQGNHPEGRTLVLWVTSATAGRTVRLCLPWRRSWLNPDEPWRSWAITKSTCCVKTSRMAQAGSLMRE